MPLKSKVETQIDDADTELESEVENNADGQVEHVESTDAEADTDDTAEILADAQELAENGETEVKENETHEESVKQALKDLSKKPSDGTEDSEVAESKDKTSDNSVTPKPEDKNAKPKKEDRFDPDLLPPDHFTLEQKEVFNRIPKDLRRAVTKIVKGQQAEMTRATQESARAREETRGLMEACQPFAAEFGRVGMTIPQGIVTLLATQKALTDPKTSRAAYIMLGKDLELLDENAEKVLRGQGGEAGGTVDISNHPRVIALEREIKGLREKVDPIHDSVKNSEQQRDAEVTNSITTELRSVINEMDGSGRYLNPKLHDPEFLEAWKPLVSAIARTDKTVKSWREAGKKAYDRLTGRSSSAGNQATPSSRNNRPVSAAVSVRGRTSTSNNVAHDETEVPANETHEESARRALEDLRRGII